MTTERVLIIGGSSGIGLALAELLLADGAQVTIAGRSADRLAAAAKR
jgi:NAD(P)-dependent dehydrogenase (short-subunit alcohol dehydrogenase family)